MLTLLQFAEETNRILQLALIGDDEIDISDVPDNQELRQTALELNGWPDQKELPL